MDRRPASTTRSVSQGSPGDYGFQPSSRPQALVFKAKISGAIYRPERSHAAPAPRRPNSSLTEPTGIMKWLPYAIKSWLVSHPPIVTGPPSHEHFVHTYYMQGR